MPAFFCLDDPPPLLLPPANIPMAPPRPPQPDLHHLVIVQQPILPRTPEWCSMSQSLTHHMLTSVRMSINMNKSNLTILLCSCSDDRISNKMVTTKSYRNTIIGEYLLVLFSDLLASCLDIVKICPNISYVGYL